MDKPTGNCIIIRPSERKDCRALVELKKELAAHQDMSNSIMLSPAEIERDGFDKDPPLFHSIVAEQKDTSSAVGFALYFYAYSAMEGKTLHLEDLCVSKSSRGQGIGSMLLKNLAKIAVKENCSRIQLEVLEWNDSALKFYNSYEGVNTTISEGWQNFRFNREAIDKLASLH